MWATRKLRFNTLVALTLALGAGTTLARAQSRSGTQTPQAQSSQPPPPQPSPQPSFTSVLAKTVAFITVPYKEVGAAELKGVSGTCFFVGVPDDRLGKEEAFLYLVTNRHVANAEGAPASSVLREVYLRWNLLRPQGGKTAVDSAVKFEGWRHWYFPADPTVDLAVLPFGPDLKTLDVRLIPVSMLATDEVIESRSVSVGDPIFFVGYFSQFPGIQHADPIYRSGVLAMMPADPIPMRSDPTDAAQAIFEHLWLADAHAFLGNSGSPLFINFGGYRDGSVFAGVSDYLLGIVNGFIPERDGIVTGAATFEEAARHDLPNSGILTFVPAQKLRDLLYDPELQGLRDEIVAAREKH